MTSKSLNEYKHWKWKLFLVSSFKCRLIKRDYCLFLVLCWKFFEKYLVPIRIKTKWTSFTERCIFNFMYFSNSLKRKCVKIKIWFRYVRSFHFMRIDYNFFVWIKKKHKCWSTFYCFFRTKLEMLNLERIPSSSCID